MKLWKKILIALVCVIALTQIPFIYNRYKIGQLAGKISQLEAQKTNSPNQNYNDFKGVIHVHTSLGGHSTGTFEELVEGAGKNALDFVVMTEHVEKYYDTSAMTLQNVHNGVLFINGNELSTKSDDRFLLVPGSPDANLAHLSDTRALLEKAHSNDQLAFVSYPEKFKSWETEIDGVEVFSLHTNAKQMNPALFLFDAIWSYYSYPELTFANYFVRPDANLQKFDEVSAQKKISLFGGSDAHSNLGFHLFGDDAGNKIINLKFDRYETIFRLVRQHVLIEKDKEFNRENLLDALKKGHSFIGFDVLSDSSGFTFAAENGAENKIVGDEISLQNGVKLKANAPQAARFVIFKNGAKIFEESGVTEIAFDAKETGAYRVEVYLDALGEPFNQMPWIISNPIFVR